MAGPESFTVYGNPESPDYLITAGFLVRRNRFAEEELSGSPLGLAMYAGRWAVEWGILDYDMDELERWVLDTFVPHNRIQTQAFSLDFEGILAEYLVERQNNVLQVAQERRPATMTDPGLRGVPDQYVISLPLRENFIRHRAGAYGHYLGHFQQWLRGRNVSPQVILNNLRTRIQHQETTRCLGQDVNASLCRARIALCSTEMTNSSGFNFQSKQEPK